MNIYFLIEVIDDQVREVDNQFCELERNLSGQFEKCRRSESVRTLRVLENIFSEYLFVHRTWEVYRLKNTNPLYPENDIYNFINLFESCPQLAFN